MITADDHIGHLLERLVHQSAKTGDDTKFTPRKYYQTLTLPAQLATGSAVWVTDFDSPPQGKIWNLRFAALYSNDPTNGSVVGGAGGTSPAYTVAIGKPNKANGTVQSTAQLNQEESLYFDSIGGNFVSAWYQTGVQPARYMHWVWPSETVYAVVLPSAALAAGSDLVLSYRVEEYDQDRLLYGETSVNQVLAFRESLIPPRQQA